MAKDTSNPFVLPGFGQTGESASNPLFAGLDMMRQAWQGMAGAAAGAPGSPNLAPMSIEDLDRRIRELQTVHNWLQLNTSMLASTIQGLEIQRSTLQTLKSFAGSGFESGQSGPGMDSTGQAAKQPDAAADSSQQDYAQAAADWWNMVQQQFEQLAQAAAASLQSAGTSAAEPAKPAAAKPAGKKTAARKTTKKSSKKA